MKIRTNASETPVGKKGVTRGSAAVVERDKDGTLKQKVDNDFAGVTTNSLREDRERAVAANPNKSKEHTFTKSNAVADGSGTKKQMKVSLRNVRNNSASPQAKKAAMRNFKIKGQ